MHTESVATPHKAYKTPWYRGPQGSMSLDLDLWKAEEWGNLDERVKGEVIRALVERGTEEEKRKVLVLEAFGYKKSLVIKRATFDVLYGEVEEVKLGDYETEWEWYERVALLPLSDIAVVLHTYVHDTTYFDDGRSVRVETLYVFNGREWVEIPVYR